jgi:hypothetical protein
MRCGKPTSGMRAAWKGHLKCNRTSLTYSFKRGIKIVYNNPNIWICYCLWAQKVHKDDLEKTRT